VAPAIAHGPGGTTWVGAGRGSHDREFVDARGDELLDSPSGPVRHRRVFFGDDTWARFYQRTANGFLWPLLHLVRVPLPERTGYFPRPACPDVADWSAFRAANRRYAEAALDAGGGESVWVHDYQLGFVPRELRELGYRGRIGFFLHTPFPDIALVEREAGEDGLTLFREWLRGVAAADLVGLQSPADVGRFRTAIAAPGSTAGSGRAAFQGRTVRFGAYPVGFDTAEIASLAKSAPPFDALAMLSPGAPVVVGLERQDYTKGIPERLHAMAALWRAGLRFHYLGLASPTREGVPGYGRFEAALASALRVATEAAEAAGSTCLQEARALAWPEVVALLRDASVVCTSSLADGMNLVPLQAAIAQGVRPAAERGVITTGRDAGVAAVYAAYATEGLVAVDPFDSAAFARALRLALEGRPGRVSDRLGAAVRAGDARAWAGRFLADLNEARAC